MHLDYYFIKFYLLKHGRLICLSENLISQDPIDELKEYFSIGLAQFDRKRNQQRVNARMREGSALDFGSSGRQSGWFLRTSCCVRTERTRF